MIASDLSPEMRDLAETALKHQQSSRFAEAAQSYATLLSRAPQLWPACYNLALVYQHLHRLPEAAEMYARAVQLNPQLAAGYNNLGNVLKALKNDRAAIDAYKQALTLNPALAEASYNLAIMLQASGDREASIDALRQAVAGNPTHSDAWDALYRGLLGKGQLEQAIRAFLDWESAAEMTPELVAAGLALCRPMGDRQRENRYLSLALAWPFASFKPEQYAPVLGMIQYFDLSRDDLLACYRRYDHAVAASQPAKVSLLSHRAADDRLRIGYVSGDFRQHVMGRMMLDVIARHDRDRFSILLISTCGRDQQDAITAEFRRHADGFADVSELDDFAAARSIAEADIDVLVDLAGHTNSARPGIFAHRPARKIVSHLGYHGCLGLAAVDYKLTDAIADLGDAAAYQIEKPFPLEGCVFPFTRIAPADPVPALGVGLKLQGKFVFGAFLNVLKLSPRCLATWARVLDALPEAMLLFSPLDSNEQLSIERVTAAGGIDRSRIAILDLPQRDEATLRARYRLVNAVLDTFPYAGGDTTLAALDMAIPVVTLAGQRQSERIGASILSHLGLDELVAATEDEFVGTAIRLAREPAYLAGTRRKIAERTAAAVSNADDYTRSLENAFVKIAARTPVAGEMKQTARQFFQAFHEAVRRQLAANEEKELSEIAEALAELRREQPDYPPLLRAQIDLAQKRGDLPLAANGMAALVKLIPEDIDARLSLADFLVQQNAAAEALKVIDDAMSTEHSNVRALQLQTLAHIQLRQWEPARRVSELAVEIAPADTQALFRHGTILSHLGEFEAALTFLNRTLILAPDHAEAAYNAGVILAELGNHVDAEKVFRRALGTTAARLAHLRLLQSLWADRRRDEWKAEARRFTTTYSGQEYSRLLESRLARDRGNLTEEEAILLPLCERAILIENDSIAAELIGDLLKFLPWHDVSPRLLQQLQQRYIHALAALHPPIPAAPRTESLPRQHEVKIGYLVDFSLPVVAEVIAGLSTHRDRNRIAMSVYAVSPASSIPHDQLAAAGVDVVCLAAHDEQLIAERIRRDGIDVLIDAAGFGAYARPGVLSHRPAPAQIALPGFARPSTIGELDWRVSDRVLDFSDGVESLQPVPCVIAGCALPLVGTARTAVDLTRAELGVGEEVTIFGILAEADRLSLRNVALWKALADRLPEAKFLVHPRDTREQNAVRNILSAAGIDAARLLSLPAHTAPGPSWRGLIDVILDPVPGSDYLSVVAAFADAIPIVTMSGRMPHERVAMSILSHLGETSTIAASGRDYVDIAAQFTGSRELCAAWSTRVAALFPGVLTGESSVSLKAFARQFETAVIRILDERAQARPTPKV